MSWVRVLPDWPFEESGRRELIVRLVRSGMTGAAAAAKVGVSRQRAWQVWTSETGAPLPTRERQHEQAQVARALRRRWCRSCHADYSGPRTEHGRTEVHIRCVSVNVERQYERTKARLRGEYHRLHPNSRHYKLRATP